METNETIFDQPIEDWQRTIDEGVAIIQAARGRVNFAIEQRDKLVMERMRWLGNVPVQEVLFL